MANGATGTPTSPDNIPTLATSDSPAVGTNQGINAVIAAIQTALTGRVSSPSSPATHDAMVWNGTDWVAQQLDTTNLTASAGILLSQLAIGGGAAGEVLANQGGTNVWKNPFQAGMAASNADLNLTITHTDIPGCAITRSISGSGVYVAISKANMTLTGVQTGQAGVMYIDLDGTEVGLGVNVSDSYEAAQTYGAEIVTFAMGTLAAGSHTWKSRGYSTGTIHAKFGSGNSFLGVLTIDI